MESLFKKHVFRVDETILFEVSEASMFVLFRNIFQSPRQASIFLLFERLFCIPGSIPDPKWVFLRRPGPSFWSHFGDVLAAWGPVGAPETETYDFGSI